MDPSRRHPRIWSGTFDATALAAALIGLMIVGPMDLFLPNSSPLSGPFLWLMMLSLYGLGVTLWNLLARPRLVIFNVKMEQLRPLLGELAARLDPESTAVGESYLLPQLGLQFHLESYPPLHNISLVAIGDRQSFSGWRRLRGELRAALRDVQGAGRAGGIGFLVVGLVLQATTLWWLAGVGGPALRRQLDDLLRVPPAGATQLPTAP